MRYLSVFSGMESASVAWKPLGFQPVGFSEIEPFACELLKQRFPEIKNYGDIEKYKEWDLKRGSVDILIGGSPCTSFTISGLRKGLEDPRGNLALVYLGLAEKLRPRWIVWENVPGVLSSGKPAGTDFKCFLSALAQFGYDAAWRVLDSRYFGLAQRRKRVWLVASSHGGEACAEVLFEQGCFERNKQEDSEGAVSPTLQTTCNDYSRADGFLIIEEPEGYRRIDCVEAERLQGFPDDWSRISWRGRDPSNCPQGPRFKVCGNTFSVPVCRWIGERIKKYENKN